MHQSPSITSRVLRDIEASAIQSGTQHALHFPLNRQFSSTTSFVAEPGKRIWYPEGAARRPRNQIQSPMGGIGDMVWGRESYSLPGYVFLSDRIPDRRGEIEVIYRDTADGETTWQPPTTMPRWASRLTLVITDLAIRRISDLTEEDAKLAGVTEQMAQVYEDFDQPYLTVFRDDWVKYHRRSERRWSVNPLIWSFWFSVHHMNIDEVA